MKTYRQLIKELKKASLREAAIFMKYLARNIRSRRRQLGMTQDEVADLLGFSRTSIVNIEAGNQNFPVSKLILIAEVLKTTPEKLVCHCPVFNNPDEQNQIEGD